MGLDQPVYVQYWNWFSRVLRGDFGKSLLTGSSITERVALRFPATLQLTILSMIVSVLIALPLGIASAVYRNSIWDSLCSFIGVIGVSMPSFWLGMLFIIFFSLNLSWLPTSGFVSILENPIEGIRHLIMPAFSMGASFAATTMRQTRNALLEVLNQDYMITAKAKAFRLSDHLEACTSKRTHPSCHCSCHADRQAVRRRHHC